MRLTLLHVLTALLKNIASTLFAIFLCILIIKELNFTYVSRFWGCMVLIEQKLRFTRKKSVRHKLILKILTWPLSFLLIHPSYFNDLLYFMILENFLRLTWTFFTARSHFHNRENFNALQWVKLIKLEQPKIMLNY